MESEPTKEELIEREEAAERVENALVAGYLGDWRGVEREYIFIKELDRKLSRRGRPPTGILDNIRDISYGRYEKRPRFLKAQKQAMNSEMDENLRAMVKYRLKTDEMIAANELLADDKYNRAAFILNHLIRSGSYVFMGYFPAVIDSGMSILLNIDRLTQLSIRERKALILYKQYVEKYPDSRDARKLRKKIKKMERKVVKDEYARAIREGREAYGEGRWDNARALFQYGMEFEPGSENARKWIEKTDRACKTEREAIARALEPQRAKAPLPENEVLQDLLIAGLIGLPDIMIIKADAILAEGNAEGIDDEARYLIAVAHDMSGAHEEAVAILKSVARKHRKSNMARHARLALSNPDYHRYSRIQEARADYWRDMLSYIISGQQMAKDSAVAAPARVLSQGAGAVRTLGIFNALGIAVRTLSAGMTSPISDQEIIESAEEYLIRYPDSKRTESVHWMLARAYERRGEYRKAINHYRKAGDKNPERTRKLEEKKAAQWLAIADGADDSKESYYSAIITSYPGSRSAPMALERLEELERKTRKWSIDKKALKANPAIRVETALCLGDHLFDEDPANGEIDRSGVHSMRERSITMQIVTEISRENISLEMGPERYARVTAMVDDIKYRENLRRYRTRRGDIIPIEIHGTVGSRGVHVYPRLKQRKYKDPDRKLYE